MPKPFDATTRLLTQSRPDDWITYLGLPTGTTTTLDADLSTVSLAACVTASRVRADRLLRVDAAPTPYILHLEFESGKSTAHVPFRLLQYGVQAKAKFGLPVVSTVFLLHKPSDSPQITGTYKDIGPSGQPYLTFGYGVVRVWTENVEKFLTGGLSLLPLAPVANVTPEQLPGIIKRMEVRVDVELPGDTDAGEFWVATYILMGLRYNKTFNAPLLQGVKRMKESVTYQAIVEEGIEQGRLTEARRLVLRAATRRLGDAPADVQATLDAITGVNEMESLHDRVFEVETWEELLSGTLPH